MDPDNKKKFNFGTGEIDVDQWLLDIDAGLPEYYERMGKTYHNKENEEVRNAMTDLIGRISSGDMLSRSANGTYNFRSQLYSPNRGKYTKWAYLTALSYIGGKGRNLITPPKQQEDPTTTKNKYSTLTLIKRFNNFVQRGSTELNLDDTWWGSASMDLKAQHLSDFLTKEAAYIRGTDIDDVDDAYKDLGKEGLASAMAALATLITANPDGDYGRQFGNLGITNLLKRTTRTASDQPPLTVDLQIAQYQLAEQDAKKQIQLGWYQNRGTDAYYNNGYADFFDNAVNTLNTIHSDRKNGNDIERLRQERETGNVWFNEGATFVGADGKTYLIDGSLKNYAGNKGQYVARNFLSKDELDKLAMANVGASVVYPLTAELNYKLHFIDTNASVSLFLERLKGNWESLFTPNSEGLKYKDGENEFIMPAQLLWEGLALLTYTMPTSDTERVYAYADDKQKPVKVGNDLFYIPGTYRKNGDILLFDTYNKRLVKSSILKYPTLGEALGDALFEKEGGILKLQGGNYVPPAAAIEYNKPTVVSLGSTYESTEKPPQEVKFTSAEKARLYSSIADIGSMVVAFVPGYGTATSALLGLGSTATNFGADLADGQGILTATKNAGIGLAADVMGLVPGLGGVGKGAKVARNLLWAVPKITLWLNTMNGLSNANELIASVKKIPHPSTMTLDDWDNVRLAVQIVSGHGRSVATKVKKSAMVKHEIDAGKPLYRIKTTDGWKQVSDDTYNQLKNVRSVDARNKLSEKLLGTGVKLDHKNYNPFNTSLRFGIFRYTPGLSKIEVKGKRNHWWGDENLVEGVENFNFKKINFKNPYSKYYNARTLPNVPDKNYDLFMLQRINEDSQLRVKKPLPWPDDKPKVNPAETVKPTQDNNKNNKSNKKNKRPKRHKLGGILKILREGGVVKYQEGGKTGVNAGQEYNWYNNVFSGYRLHILDSLGTKGYVDWLNTMQGSHAGIYNAAGGKDGSWKTTAYENGSVKNYQTLYQTGFNGYDTDNPYNTTGIGKAYNTPKHYDFSGSTDRGTAEVNQGQFVGNPDGLYSQMTDDRRLLGREGDWTPEQLQEWNTALQAKGYKMELDPTDRYYRINPIDNSAQNATRNDPDPNAKKVKPAQEEPADTEHENGLIVGNPQPQLKKPFDPRALFILGRGASTILGNSWMYDRIYDRIPNPAYKDFIDRRLDTIGDYAYLAHAGNQAADLRAIQQLRLVSDQSLNLAADFESGRIGRETMDKAFLQDAAKQATTHEAALQMDLKDVEDSRDVAWYNRVALNKYLSDRADVLNAKDKASVDATLGMVNNLTQLGASKYLEKKAAYDRAQATIMQQPLERAQERMLTQHAKLYNKVANGTANDNQVALYNQLLAKYLKEARMLYATDFYSLYGGGVELPEKQHGEVESQKAITAKNLEDRMRYLRNNLGGYISAARADMHGITMKDLLAAGYVFDGNHGFIHVNPRSDKEGGKLEFIKSLRK